jgi:hypothetical protein
MAELGESASDTVQDMLSGRDADPIARFGATTTPGSSLLYRWDPNWRRQIQILLAPPTVDSRNRVKGGGRGPDLGNLLHGSLRVRVGLPDCEERAAHCNRTSSGLAGLRCHQPDLIGEENHHSFPHESRTPPRRKPAGVFTGSRTLAAPAATAL